MKNWTSTVIFTGALWLQSIANGAQLEVPGQFSTIQSAIDVAEEGDTVLVARGIYHESIRLSQKSIILASEFIHSGNVDDIYNTVLDGTNSNGETRKKTVIFVPETIGEKSRICGFTIQNGNDGVMCEGFLEIDHNRFLGNSDAIDYEDGGGSCHNNLFERNHDDAVDLDGACAVEIKQNLIRNNRDDGIEIRLHPYQGNNLLTVIVQNIITGNGEDGIQFIDYGTETNRTFVIGRNIIANTQMAGIGFMDNAVTKEDYRAAKVFETVWIENNTFVDNEYGITGSGRGCVQSNIFQLHRKEVFLGEFADSRIMHNLMWQNAIQPQLGEHTIIDDPRLNDHFVSKKMGNEMIRDGRRYESIPESISLKYGISGIGATPMGDPLMEASFWTGKVFN